MILNENDIFDHRSINLHRIEIKNFISTKLYHCGGFRSLKHQTCMHEKFPQNAARFMNKTYLFN